MLRAATAGLRPEGPQETADAGSSPHQKMGKMFYDFAEATDHVTATQGDEVITFGDSESDGRSTP